MSPDVSQQREITQQEVSLEVNSYQHQGLSQHSSTINIPVIKNRAQSQALRLSRTPSAQHENLNSTPARHSPTLNTSPSLCRTLGADLPATTTSSN